MDMQIPVCVRRGEGLLERGALLLRTLYILLCNLKSFLCSPSYGLCGPVMPNAQLFAIHHQLLGGICGPLGPTGHPWGIRTGIQLCCLQGSPETFYSSSGGR